jgi:hypothetical protein
MPSAASCICGRAIRFRATPACAGRAAARARHSSLRWAAPRASAFVTVSSYARDHRPGPVEVERPGYVDIDAGTGFRISPWMEVRVVVRNLTNA